MKTSAILWMQDVLPEEKASGVVGAATMTLGCLVVVGALVGMIVCSRASRRPTANRKAVGSLALVLASPFVGGILSVAMGGPENRAATLLSGALMIIGVLASILMAVLGLIEMKRQPEKWKEGSGFAVVTLSVSGLLVLIWGVAITLGVSTAVARAREASNIRTDYPEFGFRIDALPPRWRMNRVGGADPNVRAQFGRNQPEMYYMILSEKIEEGNEVATAAVGAIVKANLKSKTPGANTFLEEKEFIQGMEGIKLLTDIPQAAMPPLVFRHWVHAEKGWVYQLIAWSAKGDQAALLRETDAIFRGFRSVAAP